MSSFEFVARHVGCLRPEYIFEIDEYQRDGKQFLLAHIYVEFFTPSVFKQIIREWKIFRSCVSAPIFAIGATEDSKWRRFVSRLGFEPLIPIAWEGGEQRTLYLSKV